MPKFNNGETATIYRLLPPDDGYNGLEVTIIECFLDYQFLEHKQNAYIVTHSSLVGGEALIAEGCLMKKKPPSWEDFDEEFGWSPIQKVPNLEETK